MIRSINSNLKRYFTHSQINFLFKYQLLFLPLVICITLIASYNLLHHYSVPLWGVITYDTLFTVISGKPSDHVQH